MEIQTENISGSKSKLKNRTIAIVEHDVERGTWRKIIEKNRDVLKERKIERERERVSQREKQKERNEEKLRKKTRRDKEKKTERENVAHEVDNNFFPFLGSSRPCQNHIFSISCLFFEFPLCVFSSLSISLFMNPLYLFSYHTWVFHSRLPSLFQQLKRKMPF